MRTAYQRPEARKLSADEIFLNAHAQYILDFTQCTGPSAEVGVFTYQNGQAEFCSSVDVTGMVGTLQCQETGGQVYSYDYLSAVPGTISCDPPLSPYIVTAVITPSLPPYCTATSDFVTNPPLGEGCS